MLIVHPLLLTLGLTVGARGLLQWLATDRPRTPGLASVFVVGWLGGAATAISLPGVPILILLLSLVGARVVLGIRAGDAAELLLRGAAVVATRVCLGLGVALIVTLSGFPSFWANPIYAGTRWVDGLTGLLLLSAGLILLCEIIGLRVGRGRGGFAARSVPWLGEILGLALALAIYHDLDPTFDAVFFGAGMIVPASHSPWTVGFFSAGLAAVYVPLALTLASAAAASGQWSRWTRSPTLVAATAVLCLAVAIIGLGLLTGTYHGFSRRLGFTP